MSKKHYFNVDSTDKANYGKKKEKPLTKDNVQELKELLRAVLEIEEESKKENLQLKDNLNNLNKLKIEENNK